MFKYSGPHLTMHWIKEVEVVKSIDYLMTIRSIRWRTDFPDYDILDAMIAPALMRLLEQPELMKLYKSLSDLIILRLQNDDVQDFHEK